MALITPVLLMITLTMLVWIALLTVRITHFFKNHEEPTQADENITANFQNLFEVPVLFYALAILMITTIGHTGFDAMMAYVFVISRSIHSVIQCSYNNVMHRFAVYLISCLALVAMLISAIASGW